MQIPHPRHPTGVDPWWLTVPESDDGTQPVDLPAPARPGRVSATTIAVVFAGTLAAVFVLLKLAGIVDWSWLWVLAPVWLSLILAVGAVTTAVIILAMIACRM